MKDMFSIGELARYQNISKQTLIFYDKIGLFRPAYVDRIINIAIIKRVRSTIWIQF